MSLNDEWRRAFAVQAEADLRTREFLSRSGSVGIPECHRLQFLQMACEKLVKAHLFDVGSVPVGTLTSHAVIAKHLPAIVDEYYRRQQGRGMPKHLRVQVRSLSRQIELLAPAVDNAGQHPENCEYPWLDSATNQVRVPAKHGFGDLDLPREVAGRIILKVLPIAIAALLESK